MIWHEGLLDEVIPFTHVCAFGIVNAAPDTDRQDKQTGRWAKGILIGKELDFHQFPRLPTPLPYSVWAKTHGLHHSTRKPDPFDRGGEW
jgi:hypothetical protein